MAKEKKKVLVIVAWEIKVVELTLLKSIQKKKEESKVYAVVVGLTSFQVMELKILQVLIDFEKASQYFLWRVSEVTIDVQNTSAVAVHRQQSEIGLPIRNKNDYT